jgi:hypothetical protein
MNDDSKNGRNKDDRTNDGSDKAKATAAERTAPVSAAMAV